MLFTELNYCVITTNVATKARKLRTDNTFMTQYSVMDASAREVFVSSSVCFLNKSALPFPLLLTGSYLGHMRPRRPVGPAT